MNCINCLDTGVITTSVTDSTYSDGSYTTHRPCDCGVSSKKQAAQAKRSRGMTGEEYADMMMKKLGI